MYNLKTTGHILLQFFYGNVSWFCESNMAKSYLFYFKTRAGSTRVCAPIGHGTQLNCIFSVVLVGMLIEQLI